VAYKVKRGSSVKTAVTGPETIGDEILTLDEGQARCYELRLTTNRRIEISIDANPKTVNVLFMAASEWARFAKAKGSLFGGEYKYIPNLSEKKVKVFRREEVLSQGNWCVVLDRSRDSLVFTDKTAVHIVVRAM
jgi:hypothetical protein